MLSHDPSVLDKLRVHGRRRKGLAPVNTLQVGSASDVANVLAQQLPQSTSQTARELYKVLVEVAVRVEQARGHAATVTEALLHLPVELVADCIGVSRMTVWRHLPALRELGLVDHRVHKASWKCGDRVETRNSGTVFRVRLSPLRGPRARVTADDLRHKHRGRMMFGAASKRVLLRTRNIQGNRLMKILELVNWSLSPGSITPVYSLGNSPAQSALETLLDLTTSKKGDRAKAVDSAATALAQALKDAGSLNFYRLLLYRLLRRYDTTGRDDTRVILLTAQRCAVDAYEGFARKPGALFVSRLKAHGWLEAVMNAPPLRAG